MAAWRTKACSSFGFERGTYSLARGKVDLFADLAAMVAHESIEILDGLGLEGDRYAVGRGFYLANEEWDAPVTLIAKEPFDELAAKHGIVIEPGELRRNLVTKGVDVNGLVGKQFRI